MKTQITTHNRNRLTVTCFIVLPTIVIRAKAPYTQYQPLYKNPFPYSLKTVWCKMKSETNNMARGKAKAFHFVLKLAPPKRAIAPNGEKFASGNISWLK